jgi:NAD(P)H dehydrogenase (quinone)
MSDTRKPEIAPKHAVILCHPDAESFNTAIAQHYCDAVKKIGHRVVLRDLYRIGFDPVLKNRERPTSADFELAPDVVAEIDLIGGADVFVLVYPIWFATPPSMMKGYVERVLGAGFPWGAVRQRLPHPMLAGRRLLSFTSSGTAKQWLEEQGAWLSLRKLFDDYLARAFSMGPVDHVHFGSIVEGMTERVLNEHLQKVEETARRVCSTCRHR